MITNRAGYSLIEVLVALVLVDIGILAVVGLVGALVGIMDEAGRTAETAFAMSAAREITVSAGCLPSAVAGGTVSVTRSIPGADGSAVVTVRATRITTRGPRADSVASVCAP